MIKSQRPISQQLETTWATWTAEEDNPQRFLTLLILPVLLGYEEHALHDTHALRVCNERSGRRASAQD